MNSASIPNFIKMAQSPIKLETIIEIVNQSSTQCLFIKNESSVYCYANDNFAQLMGLKKSSHILKLNDTDLSKNKSDAKKYREHDSCILEEGCSLDVKEVISPRHNKLLYKMMEGTLYPLIENDKRFVLGLVQPKLKLLRLDWDVIFSLKNDDIASLLYRRSYLIQLHFGRISISKQEILILIQLVKGRHAGEISQELKIKQCTVESYIVNIKNKLGVCTKSDLIDIMFQDKILEQLIV